jgi:hypothetical protein
MKDGISCHNMTSLLFLGNGTGLFAGSGFATIRSTVWGGTLASNKATAD